MSRRLGDDPLARARGENAVPALAVGPEEAGTQKTFQRGSFNDIFFQRKSGADDPSPIVLKAPEESAAAAQPEISEISEIPELREAEAAPAPGPVDPAQADVAQAPAPAALQAGTTPAVPTVAAVAVDGRGDAGRHDSTPSTPAPKVEEARVAQQKGPEPADRNGGGGFFKRLLDKFK